MADFQRSPERYQADITAGSLKSAESRVTADLWLRGVDEDGKQARVKNNLLRSGIQKPPIGCKTG